MATNSTLEAKRVYTNYWEDDSTADPKIVRVLHRDTRETYTVQLPEGEQKQVHIHTLGRFHTQ